MGLSDVVKQEETHIDLALGTRKLSPAAHYELEVQMNIELSRIPLGPAAEYELETQRRLELGNQYSVLPSYNSF